MDKNRIDISILAQDRQITMSRRGIEIQRKGRPVGAGVQGSGAVYLAIDSSASMAGAKLKEAKRGALDFAKDAQHKGYSVGLIQFGSFARHVCGPQRELSLLRRSVNTLEVSGSTNLAAGIQLATKMLKAIAGSRTMVIVTDGQPDNRETTLAAAQEAKKSGIDIITTGTDDTDRALLIKLATRTDLSVMVPSQDLGRGIASTAKMLPGVSAPRNASDISNRIG